MAYAVQWWLFAAGVPIGWFVLARREVRDRASQDGEGDEDETEEAAEPAAV